MSSDRNVVDRIKPFIRMLEGSIDRAREDRLAQENEPSPSVSQETPRTLPSREANGRAESSHEEVRRNESTDQPIGGDSSSDDAPRLQARPLARRRLL
ncbi:MAG: hypothetical protein ACF8PN_00330 [Phycisphaerales bacterium]